MPRNKPLTQTILCRQCWKPLLVHWETVCVECDHLKTLHGKHEDPGCKAKDCKCQATPGQYQNFILRVKGYGYVLSGAFCNKTCAADWAVRYQDAIIERCKECMVLGCTGACKQILVDTSR